MGTKTPAVRHNTFIYENLHVGYIFYALSLLWTSVCISISAVTGINNIIMSIFIPSHLIVTACSTATHILITYVTACSTITTNCNECSPGTSGGICLGCSSVTSQQGRFLTTDNPEQCKGKNLQWLFYGAHIFDVRFGHKSEHICSYLPSHSVICHKKKSACVSALWIVLFD